MSDDYIHPLSINGQLMKKDARIAELEAALKPFAEYELDDFDDDKDEVASPFILVSHLRAASAALKGEKG